MRFLAGAMLITLAVELQTNPATPVESGASRPLQTGYVLKRLPFSVGHHPQAGMPRIRLWESTSGNWSGYAVPLETSSVKDTFSDVQGSWAVPAVTGTAGSAAYAATWVGLDGYDDGTVEQTGTLQEWTGTKQVNYAWFEMYPGPMYEIEAPVAVGDTITASVSYAGTKSVRVGRQTRQELVFNVTISDVTQGWTEVVPTSYTTVTSAARASAEWIAEAPSSSRGILPLADFGTVNFSGCTATSTGSGGAAQPISFWPDDPLTMIDPNGGEAAPSGLSANGEAFSVVWSQ